MSTASSVGQGRVKEAKKIETKTISIEKLNGDVITYFPYLAKKFHLGSFGGKRENLASTPVRKVLSQLQFVLRH